MSRGPETVFDRKERRPGITQFVFVSGQPVVEMVRRVGRDKREIVTEFGVVPAHLEHSLDGSGHIARFVIVKRKRCIAPVARDMDIFDAAIKR